MRALIIHNPKSGFGSDSVFQLERMLAREGDEVLLRMLVHDFDPQVACSDAEGFDLVVVSGGDGTVASLLGALAGRGVPTCVFPSGTANLLCANIGNAHEPTALALACRAGRTADLDLGVISWEDGSGTALRRPFALMSGTGFDAQLMRAALPNKAVMGEAAYFAAALANPRPAVTTYTITVDGQTHVREGIACMVANNAMIQGDIEIVPGCRMDDGLIDVVVIKTKDAAQLLRPAALALVDHEGKKLGRPYFETFKGTRVRIESSEPMPLEIDGEVIEGDVLAYEAQVLPGAARIIVDDMSPYSSAR